MLQTTWIALLLGFWSSLYLIDAFFKSYHLTALHYLRLLEETGISISIGQLRWYTTCFNRLFLRLGQFKPLFMHMWFSFGVAFGLISMVISLFVLTLMVFNTLSQQPVDQQVLTPVMPGVNLPTSQMSYYLLTLLICGILHEFGHALAAVREQVHVNGFGFFILILYPGAFVEMSTEHLKVIAPIRQLRIYCAGVWHNFIIVLAALLVLLLLPTCLLPFYTIGNSVVVSYVVQGSAVSGPRGLVVGDPITSISGCRVTSIDDWYTCIAVSIKEGNLGNCMALNVIQDLDTSMAAAFMKKNMTKTSPLNQPKDCCNQTSNTHLCFMYHVKSLPKTAYGIVWKATDRKTGDVVAVKKIFDAFRNETDAQRTFREIMFLKNFCDHPNVIKLQKVIKAENDHDIYLVFEFMDTDLHNVIKRGNILKDVHKRYIMYQLFKATKYLHSGNVIHRDQKPSNILLNSDCLVKLCDFGLARSISQIGKDETGDPNLTEYVATRWYRAPEILLGSHKYTKGVDMWSLGCILGEMLTGKPLFPGSSTINQIEVIMSTIQPPKQEDIDSLKTMYGASILEKAQLRPKKELSEILKDISPEAVDLVMKLLHFNPDKRITVDEGLQHPYVARFRKPHEEISLDSDIVPCFSDEIQLSVEDYRKKLYEMIVEKNFWQTKHHDKIDSMRLQKERTFYKENRKQLSPLTAVGCPYTAGPDVSRDSLLSASKSRLSEKVKTHTQMSDDMQNTTPQHLQNQLKPVSRFKLLENSSHAVEPNKQTFDADTAVSHNISAPVGNHHRTSSITAMIQTCNPTITRDKTSLCLTSSPLNNPRPESAKSIPPRPAYGRRQFNNIMNNPSVGVAKYTFGSYSQAYGTITASGLAALNKKKY